MSQVDRIRNAQRHERLRELMATKVERLSKTNLTDKQREFIRHEVDLLIHNGDASESSLHRVAASLRVFSERPQPSSTTPQPTTKRAPSDFSKRATEKPTVSPLESADAAHRRQNPSEAHADDVWAHLSKRDAEEFAREQLEHRKLLKRKENEQRNFLETQVNRRTEMKMQRAEEERQEAARDKEQVRIWQIEEQRKKDDLRNRLANERQMRDDQLRLAKEKKARDETSRREEDLRQAEQIRDAIRKEEEQNELKKLKTKEEVAKFQAINRMHEEEKQREREREAEMDKVHQRQHLERLAKQEQERDEALAKMHEKQRHQQTMATQMQASVAEKAADDERKAKEYALKKEQQEAAEAQRKADKQSQEKTKIKQYLAMQLLERENQRAEERARQERLREQMKRDVESAEREEYMRNLRRKEKQDYQRQLLEQQMTEKSTSAPVFMTDEERRLNAKLIDRASQPSRRV